MFLKPVPKFQDPELLALFQEVNTQWFDAFLEPPILRWNSRLRSAAGRFFPGSRKWAVEYPPAIEIASYLRTEERALELIRDTMAHEMIHYWLWVRRKPYGHTGEFLEKMRQMGVSRYNQVPRLSPYKYLYRCPGCQKEFKTRKKLGVLACADCCKAFAGGRFDIRFRLLLDPAAPPVEASQR